MKNIQLNSFLNTLIDANDGAVVETLDSRFAEVVQAVRSNRQKAVMAVKLTISPDRFSTNTGEVIGVKIDWQVENKLPGQQPGTSVFFVAEDGKLARTLQADLFDGRRAEVKEDA